jgi:hypothetical protein
MTCILGVRVGMINMLHYSRLSLQQRMPFPTELSNALPNIPESEPHVSNHLCLEVLNIYFMAFIYTIFSYVKTSNWKIIVFSIFWNFLRVTQHLKLMLMTVTRSFISELSIQYIPHHSVCTDSCFANGMFLWTSIWRLMPENLLIEKYPSFHFSFYVCG